MKLKKRFHQLNPRKAISVDKLSITLIKVAVEPLSTSLSIAISNSFKHNIFPSNAKVTVLSLWINRRKAYETCLKCSKFLLVCKIEMFLSSLVEAYRNWYNTQHVLVRLIEECRENLDNTFFV